MEINLPGLLPSGRLLVAVTLVVSAPLFAGPALAVGPVSVTCGQTLTADTTVGNDLVDCPGAGLIVGADDITIDLGSHTIDGLFDFFNTQVGIDNGAGHVGVRIRDGKVRQFFVNIRSTGSGTVIEDVATEHSFNGGVRFEGVAGGKIERCSVTDPNEDSGIVLDGTDGVLVRSCAVSGAEDNAIRMVNSHHNRLENNLLVDSTSGIEMHGSDQNAIRHNTLKDNGVAIFLGDSDSNEVSGNTVSPEPGGSGTIFGDPLGVLINGGRDNRITGNAITATCCIGGIDVTGSEGTVVDGNTVTIEGNGQTPNAAIVVRSASRDTMVSRNVANSHLTDGILVLDGAIGTLLLRNQANRNGLDGIRVLAISTTIAKNTADDNGNLGIEAVTGVIDGGGNKASGNGISAQCVGVLCT